MRCLVIGANGFLGRNLLEALRENGNVHVSAGVRSEQAEREVAGIADHIERVDLTDRSSLDRAVEGNDVVFHVAADTSAWSQARQRQREVNVEGTRNVAQACQAMGVRRLVHTSTIDILGYRDDKELISESTGRYNFHGMGYHYGDTKHEAITWLEIFADESDLEVVSVLPGFMCGPHETEHQVGSVFFELRDKSLLGSPPGGSSFCDVRDVARAHVAAATQGRPGERYACAGENMATHDFFTLMANAIDASPPARVLPEKLMVAYGAFEEFRSRFTKKAPLLNPGMARYMSRFQYIDSSKAKNELGYQTPDLAETVAASVASYRERGHDI